MQLIAIAYRGISLRYLCTEYCALRAEEGVRQARLCTEILYQNRLEKLAALSEADARVLFKNAPLFTLLRDPSAHCAPQYSPVHILYE